MIVNPKRLHARVIHYLINGKRMPPSMQRWARKHGYPVVQ